MVAWHVTQPKLKLLLLAGKRLIIFSVAYFCTCVWTYLHIGKNFKLHGWVVGTLQDYLMNASPDSWDFCGEITVFIPKTFRNKNFSEQKPFGIKTVRNKNLSENDTSEYRPAPQPACYNSAIEINLFLAPSFSVVHCHTQLRSCTESLRELTVGWSLIAPWRTFHISSLHSNLYCFTMPSLGWDHERVVYNILQKAIKAV